MGYYGDFEERAFEDDHEELEDFESEEVSEDEADDVTGARDYSHDVLDESEDNDTVDDSESFDTNDVTDYFRSVAPITAPSTTTTNSYPVQGIVPNMARSFPYHTYPSYTYSG